ncbi:MAG: hypothetical protein H2057_01920 [Alphaproteobacteria bacterium]|nr:hypothetical protein [Alphaproteobacteria bacterium]
MTQLNKKLFLTLTLGISCLATEGVHATQTKIHPLSNAMVAIINNAPDANAATQELCKQKGVLRGSGFSAGNNCKLQDLARVAVVACTGFRSGSDTFAGSNCAKEATKVGITEVARAADALRLAVRADVAYTTNAKFLICGPDNLPDVTAYRRKLPAGLRAISDAACPAPTLQGANATTQGPARPTTQPPVGSALQIKTPPAPIEFSNVIQGALRDLAPADANDIQSLFEGQNYLLNEINDLKTEEQKLVASKKAQAQIEMVQQEQQAALATYVNLHSTLSAISLQLKTQKAVNPVIMDKARKIATDIKAKQKKVWNHNPLYVGK